MDYDPYTVGDKRGPKDPMADDEPPMELLQFRVPVDIVRRTEPFIFAYSRARKDRGAILRAIFETGLTACEELKGLPPKQALEIAPKKRRMVALKPAERS